MDQGIVKNKLDALEIPHETAKRSCSVGSREIDYYEHLNIVVFSNKNFQVFMLVPTKIY
jgi:hypothetical protein